jgi:hypothetical protein
MFPAINQYSWNVVIMGVIRHRYIDVTNYGKVFDIDMDSAYRNHI